MRIAGVATVKDRQTFFHDKAYPSIAENVEEVWDWKDYYTWGDCKANSIPGTDVDMRKLYGDAGKFVGFAETEEECYYFSCDDDLVYSPEYFDLLEKWLKKYDNKVVVSLHGSSFRKFPIDSYYGDKHGTHCLHPNQSAKRTIFPGTGALAFHSSLFLPSERANFLDNFLHPNMADIWMGLLLQKKKIPAVVVPHNGDLLEYNHELPIAETIWGQSHRSDFLQTAVVNEFARTKGFRFPPLPLPQSPERRQNPGE